MPLPLADVLSLTADGITVIDHWLDKMEEARKGDGGGDGGRIALDPDEWE